MGDRIVAIGDLDPQALTDKAKSQHRPETFVARAASKAFSGSPGETLTLTLAGPSGISRDATITRAESPGDVVQLGYLPPLTVVFHEELLTEGVGLIRFNVFMQPAGSRFTQAMTHLLEQGAQGMVVDLRGNPGGVVAMIMGMAGHFVGTPGQSLGQITQRHMTLYLRINPRLPEQRLEGPVAILVDELSASTSEVLAAGLQGLGRARVFGTRSAGMALPSIFEVLPNGDGFQFAIGDLHGPNGKRLEGQGVQPDVVVPLTASQLEARQDPVMNAAVDWIQSEIAP